MSGFSQQVKIAPELNKKDNDAFEAVQNDGGFAQELLSWDSPQDIKKSAVAALNDSYLKNLKKTPIDAADFADDDVDETGDVDTTQINTAADLLVYLSAQNKKGLGMPSFQIETFRDKEKKKKVFDEADEIDQYYVRDTPDIIAKKSLQLFELLQQQEQFASGDASSAPIPQVPEAPVPDVSQQNEDADSDEDLPPLEDTFGFDPIADITTQQNVALDDDDDDMPSLEDILDGENDATNQSKIIGWINNIAQLGGNNDIDETSTDTKSSLITSSNDDDEDPEQEAGYTSSSTLSYKPYWDEGASSFVFDLRHNQIPPGVSIMNKAYFERSNDGSTALVLEPGSFMQIYVPFKKIYIPPNGSLKFVLTIDFMLPELPESTITMCTADLSRNGFVISRDGSVGFSGCDLSGIKVKPKVWNRLAFSLDPARKEHMPVICTLNNKIINMTQDCFTVTDKDGPKGQKLYMYICGNNKQSFTDRTIKIRSISMSPRMLSQYNNELVMTSAGLFSTYQQTLAEDKIKMYKQFSLRQLYSRPPPAWHHPLLQSFVNKASFTEALSPFVHYTNYYLWSLLLNHTSQNHTELFPQITSYQRNKYLQEGTRDNNGGLHYFSSTMQRISNIFLSASILNKLHPVLTQQPTGQQFARKIAQQIEVLDINEIVLIPFLIKHKVIPVTSQDGSSADEEKPRITIDDAQLHFIIQPTSTTLANVTIINTFHASGVRFHGTSAADNITSLQYKPCITVKNVDLSLLKSHASWFGLYEAIFSAKRISFHQIDTIYFKILPIILGKSWEQVIYESQQRDIEYCQKMVKTDKTDSYNVDISAYADSEYKPFYGMTGTSTQLLEYTTEFLFKLFGVSSSQAQSLLLAMKLRVLDMCFNDLSYTNVITLSDKFQLEAILKQVALSATAAIDYNPLVALNHKKNTQLMATQSTDTGIVFTSKQLYVIYRGILRIQRELSNVKIMSYNQTDQPTLLLDDSGRTKDSQYGFYPLAEQYIVAKDVETLLGSASPAIISFDLLDLPGKVTSWGELLYVLRKALEILITLRNQTKLVKQAMLLSATFLTSLFSHIIPIPVSPHATAQERAQCFYWNNPITFAESHDLMNVLQQLQIIAMVLHFHYLGHSYAWFQNSLDGLDNPLSATNYDKNTDIYGKRVLDIYSSEMQLISGVLFAILDYILHKQPADQRSPLVDTILQGKYGLNLLNYIESTDSIALHTPELAIVRAKVIGYFALTQIHYKQMLLTIQDGTPGPEYPALQSSLILSSGGSLTNLYNGSMFDWNNNPVYFRVPALKYVATQICVFRCMLVDPRLALPQARQCFQGENPYAYALYMQDSGSAMTMNVFNLSMPLPIPSNLPISRSNCNASYLINSHLFTLHTKGGSSSNLFSPTDVKGEDDILHLPTLPNFGETLSLSDAEIMLSYLTVPYLRIPLLLTFFAQEDRCHGLKSPELAKVLLSAMFEQGNLVNYVSPTRKDIDPQFKYLPSNVPVLDKTERQQLIGTQYGYLLNELVHDPATIVTSLITILNNVLDLDIGTCHASSTPIILFVIRLLCYTQNYMKYLLDLNDNHVALYTATDLPSLVLTREQYATLKAESDKLQAIITSIALNKVAIWSSELFSQVHLKLEQQEYAAQIAQDWINKADTVLKQHELNEQDDEKETETTPPRATNPFGQPWRGFHSGFGGRGRSRARKFGKHSRAFHMQNQNQNEQDTAGAEKALPKLTAVVQTDKFKITNLASKFRSSLETNDSSNPFSYRPSPPATELTTYKFEDNRNRRTGKVLRKKATIARLGAPGEEKKNESEAKKDPDSELFKSVENADENKQSDALQMDGAKLSDTLQLSCVLHAHLLLIYRNIDMTNVTACNVLSSMMYISTHYSYDYQQFFKSEQIYEVYHKLRKPLIDTANNLKQQALNDFMQRVVLVATCKATIDVNVLTVYLKQQAGFSADQVHDKSVLLPTNHALYTEIETLTSQQNQLYRLLLANPSDDIESVEDGESKTIKHWGYVPGSSGRYVSLMTPLTLSAPDFESYKADEPADVYDKNLDCEVNLQTCMISVRNSSMMSFPDSIVYSEAWSAVFGRPLQGALISKDSKMDWYRVIGTGYDVYQFHSSHLTPEVDTSRYYSSSDLTKSEGWVGPLFEPFRLKYLSDPTRPVHIFLPPESLPASSEVCVLNICSQKMQPLMEIRVYKQRKHIEGYAFVAYNNAVYKSCIYTSNTYYSLASLNMSTQPREELWDYWERHSNSFRLPHFGITHIDVVITRDTTEIENLSGGTETFFPSELLEGSIPHALTESFEFWRDTAGNLRGYQKLKTLPCTPIHNCADYIIFCELISLDKVDFIGGVRGTVFNITKVPVSIMKKRLEAKLLGHANSLAITTLSTTLSSSSISPQSSLKDDAILIPHKIAEKRSSMAVKHSKQEHDELNTVYQLANLCHAPKASASYQINSVLTKLTNTGLMLPWVAYNRAVLSLNGAHLVSHYPEDDIPVNDPLTIQQTIDAIANTQVTFASHLIEDDDDVDELLEDGIDVDVYQLRKDIESKLLLYSSIEIPSLSISFKSQFNANNELQLFNTEFNDLYISNIRTPQLSSLLRGLEGQGLILQNNNDELTIVAPAFLCQRPFVLSAPYSTELVINRQKSNLLRISTTLFHYPVHASHSFVFIKTLEAALYLLYARFAARDYDGVIRLLDSIAADVPFSAGESAMFNMLQDVQYDIHSPDAVASMLRVSLATLKATRHQPWNVWSLLVLYSGLNYHHFASSTTKLSFGDELTLLRSALDEDLLKHITRTISKPDIGHILGLLASYNRLTYVTALQYNLPSRKVLTLPNSTHRASYFTASLPTPESLLLWYMEAVKEVNLLEIPSHTLYHPGAHINYSNKDAHKDVSSVTIQYNHANGETEINEAIPLTLKLKLLEFAQNQQNKQNPQQRFTGKTNSDFKCDITSEEQFFRFIGTLSPLSAQQVIATSLQSENLQSSEKRGFGFLFIYMLLTGETIFKLNGVDYSLQFAQILFSLFSDYSHKHPLNYALRLMMQSPELIPLFPRVCQYMPLNQLRNNYRTVAPFPLGPFILMVIRVIVKLYIIDPKLVTLRYNFDLKSCRIEQPSEIIPTLVLLNGNNGTNQPFAVSPFTFREVPQPVHTDTDCNFRLSVGYNIFLQQDGQVDPNIENALKTILKQEIQEEKALQSFLPSDYTTKSTNISHLQQQPMATLNITQFIQQVVRAEKNLGAVADILPFDVSSHPSATSSIAKMLKTRLDKDMTIYAERANSSKDLLFLSLHTPAVVNPMLSKPNNPDMLHSLELLQNLKNSIIILRQNDIKFVSLGQTVVKTLVNNVGFPEKYQTLLKKSYHIETTCFSANGLYSDDEKFDINPLLDLSDNHCSSSSSISQNGIDVESEVEFTRRLHFNLLRFAGLETEMWFEYVVGTLISSRSNYDLLKVNPFIPKQHIALLNVVTEAVLLRSNRIKQVNRILYEISELQHILYKVRALHRHGGVDAENITTLTNTVVQKSQSLANALFAKRYYYNDVSQQALDDIKLTLRVDDKIAKQWEYKEKQAILQISHDKLKSSSNCMFKAVAHLTIKSPLMCEQIARVVNKQVFEQDLALIQKAAKADEENKDGALIKLRKKLNMANSKHIVKQALIDPISVLKYHPLKAACPIRDLATFYLQTAQKQSKKIVNQVFERVNAGQDVSSQDFGNPFFDVQNPPEYFSLDRKHAKQGKYGVSLYGRSGLTTDMLDRLEKNHATGTVKSYDPRFAVFEFTWSLILRQGQVASVNEFVDVVNRGESLVTQALMGEGKTQILVPLLAIMLNQSEENMKDRALQASKDGVGAKSISSQLNKLVVMVVPPALLEFSRSILRSTFSSVIFKKVITFSFDRATETTPQMVLNLQNAATQRQIVISAPTSLKSVMLKLLETQYAIANPELQQRDEDSERTLCYLNDMVELFKQSTLVIDEVDSIMHPLKSELNFPLGIKEDLDGSPMRWQLAMHILDSILYYHDHVTPQQFASSKRAHTILENLAAEMQRGVDAKYLSINPHIVLLNVEYYSKLLPLIVEWVLLYLDGLHLSTNIVSHDDLRLYFSLNSIQLSREENAALVSRINSLPPLQVKSINLSRDWVCSYLPHVLSKINRVHYGLISPSDLCLMLTHDPHLNASRQKLAIPFSGLETPSISSEFAHVDILVAFTYVSFFYEGLRYVDFAEIVSTLQTSVMKELGAYNKRPSNLKYIEWVNSAGGIVLGGANDLALVNSHNEDTDGSPSEIVSIRLLKQTNHSQMDRLYKLWRHHQPVIQWYLDTIVFPAHLRHQKLKLSASGCSLVSLFKQSIGFSGTPSDLLPHDLGKCQYARGADGEVVHVLAHSTNISQAVVMKDNETWSVNSLLKYVAQQRTPNGDLMYNALIDVGALITGKSSLEVSLFLLENGLADFVDGVVYLDEEDKKMVLLKSNLRSVPLDQSGLPPHRRFVYYSNKHCVGMDILNRLDARALCTISQNNVWRDLAQGAYRLRQLGMGQTIHILVVPELKSLINRCLAECNIGYDKNTILKDEDNIVLKPVFEIIKQQGITDLAIIEQKLYLAKIAAFLVINSMKSERVQFSMLCLQNVQNIWRKEVFSQLLTRSRQYFTFQRFKDEGYEARKLSKAKAEKETKYKTFLKSIEPLQITNRKQYKLLYNRYHNIVKKNEKIEYNRQQKELLNNYFQYAMTLYSVQFKAQLTNVKNYRDPNLYIDELMATIRKYLVQQRYQFYAQPDNTQQQTTKFSTSIVGSLRLFSLKLKDDGDLVTKDNHRVSAQLDASSDTDVLKNTHKDTKFDLQIFSDIDYNDYLTNQVENGSNDEQRDMEYESLMKVFEEKVDLTLQEQVPQYHSFYDVLSQMIDENKHFILHDSRKYQLAMDILGLLQRSALTYEQESNNILSQELVQIAEEEKHKEQEQEQEQQVEIEKCVELAYSRDNEEQQQWDIELLSRTDLSTVDYAMQFYNASEMGVVPLPSFIDDNSKKNKKEIKKLTINYPQSMLVSSNYYNNTWVGYRRVKNVCFFLDWIPSAAQLMTTPQYNRFARAYDYYNLNQTPETDDEYYNIIINHEATIHDIEFSIKMVLMLHYCETNKSLNQKQVALLLSTFLQSSWEQLDLNQQNAIQIISLLTTKQLVPASDKAVETLDLSSLFPTPATTIKAKEFLKIVLTTSLLYSYEANRYNIILSLAEAETIRRYIHCKHELGLQKSLNKGEIVINSTNYVFDHYNAQNDTSFALRCLPAHGLSFGQTNNYKQSITQDTTLQLLKFFNNDIYYTDEQIATLLSVIDSNNYINNYESSKGSAQLTTKRLQQYWSSLLAAKRRVQRWVDTPVYSVLTTPSRFAWLRTSAVGHLYKSFLSLSHHYYSIYDLFTWVDINNDNKIVLSEFYSSILYIVTTLWKNYINNEEIDCNIEVIQKLIKSSFFTHRDAINVFYSLIPNLATIAVSSSQEKEVLAKKSTENPIQPSSDTPRLDSSSSNSCALTFKEVCKLMKTSEDELLSHDDDDSVKQIEPRSPVTPASTSADLSSLIVPLDDIIPIDNEIFVSLLADIDIEVAFSTTVDLSSESSPSETTDDELRDVAVLDEDTDVPPFDTQALAPPASSSNVSDEPLVDVLKNPDAPTDEADEIELMQKDPQKRTERINKDAESPVVWKEDTKSLILNFTTAVLPPGFEIIGDASFVDAVNTSKNSADPDAIVVNNICENYWKVEPFSGLLFKSSTLHQLLKEQYNIDIPAFGETVPFSFEVSVESLTNHPNAAECEGYYQCRDRGDGTTQKLAELENNIITCRESVYKSLYCMQNNINDSSAWISPVSIVNSITPAQFDEYVELYNKYKENDEQNVIRYNQLPLQLKRSLKYYDSLLEGIAQEEREAAALRLAVGREVMNHPALVTKAADKKLLFQSICKPYISSKTSILGDETQAGFILSPSQLQFGQDNDSSSISSFSDDIFTTITTFPHHEKNSYNEGQHTCAVFINNQNIMNSWGRSALQIQRDVMFFGSSLLSSCARPAKIRKIVIYLDPKLQSGDISKQFVRFYSMPLSKNMNDGSGKQTGGKQKLAKKSIFGGFGASFAKSPANAMMNDDCSGITGFDDDMNTADHPMFMAMDGIGEADQFHDDYLLGDEGDDNLTDEWMAHGLMQFANAGFGGHPDSFDDQLRDYSDEEAHDDEY